MSTRQLGSAHTACNGARGTRPAEVEFLLGNAAKAKAKLGWEPQIKFAELCAEMVAADVELMKKNPEA